MNHRSENKIYVLKNWDDKLRSQTHTQIIKHNMNDLVNKDTQVSPAMSTPNTPYVKTVDAVSYVGINILED